MRRLPLPLAFALFLALATVAATPPAGPVWAPASQASIHPGVQTVTGGGQCTSNFIFTAGKSVFIGQAAHCSSLGGPTDTNGCLTGSMPLGTPVEVDGASKPGTLVYSSWIAMQKVGEDTAAACSYNDFALIKLHPSDVRNVNPSIPRWGGPIGIGSPDGFGDDVYTYGNSGLRFGLTTLSPKSGVLVGEGGGGWTYDVYTATPGIPGDSGSAFLDANGHAMGVLVTVSIDGSNGVTDIAYAMDYARRHGMGKKLKLANGTEAFRPGII